MGVRSSSRTHPHQSTARGELRRSSRGRMAVAPVSSGRPFFTSLSHDLIDSITQFMCLRQYVLFCSTCKECRTLVSNSSYWEHYVRTVFLPKNLPWNAHSNILHGQRFKEVVMQTVDGLNHCDYSISGDLIYAVKEVTSVDRENESPDNVLQPSFCQSKLTEVIMRNWINATNPLEVVAITLQLQCGCANQHPCYWSSQPSASADTEESFVFSLKSRLSSIIGFSITPYRAYFHPDNPVYSPISASLQFLDAGSAKKFSRMSVYFETPRFPIENIDQRQEQHFPLPALCIGGIIRLVLHGMAQRQTLSASDVDGDEPVDRYYMCLSRVKIHGIPIFFDESERRKCIAKHVETAEYAAITLNHSQEDDENNFDTHMPLVYSSLLES